MKSIIALALIAGFGLASAAYAAPQKLSKDQMDKIVAGKITTQNPGGQPGGCSNNPNCAAVNPAGQQPGGHNK
jgi:hypothetical protein